MVIYRSPFKKAILHYTRAGTFGRVPRNKAGSAGGMIDAEVKT